MCVRDREIYRVRKKERECVRERERGHLIIERREKINRNLRRD